MTQSPDPEIGSLAEETAKLFGAVAGWAREQDLAGAFRHHDAAGDDAHAADGDHDVRDGAAAQGPCRWCPVCRVAHAVTHVPPEVTIHLASAFASLARAAEALVQTGPPDDPGPGGGSGAAGVERIDLADWDDADPRD